MSLLRLLAPRRRFFDPGILRDAELELVQPAHRFAEDFLRCVHHPDCKGEPDCAVSPEALRAYLDSHPKGLEYPSRRFGRPGGYRFWMRLHPALAKNPAGAPRLIEPPIAIGGTISLRTSNDVNTRLYYGHVGYHVFPPARGRHLAQRSVRLLLPLAARHLKELWITTNPENAASRRTCERLGCEMVQIIDVPAGHPLWQRGEKRKCRYRLSLEA